MCLRVIIRSEKEQPNFIRLLFSRAKWTTLGFLILAQLISQIALASTLNISPVRVELSDAKPVTTITLTNSGELAKRVQLSLYDWSHEGDQTKLQPTRELIAAPPITEIAPGKTQILRIGLRTQAHETIENAYRLLIRELPSEETVGISLTLQVSIPVFVAPQEPTQHQLDWSLEKRPNGLFLVARNLGTGHAKIDRLTLSPDLLNKKSASGNIYILPSSHYEWQLDMSSHKDTKVSVTALIGEGATSITLSTP